MASTSRDEEINGMYIGLLFSVFLALAISVPIVLGEGRHEEAKNIGIALAVIAGIFLLFNVYKNRT